jgi:acyl carrier protein phosphodiesterase
MNFLAHAFLAQGSSQDVVGNLLGDFVKGRVQPQQWPPAVARGILLHRAVDTFTDAHPRVRLSKQRISPLRRRYAGIIVDVSFDHFLARHWDIYSGVPLPQFTRFVYRSLQAHAELLPERLRAIAPRMAEEDWLGSYRQQSSAAYALDRIALRLRQPNALAGAGAELQTSYAALEADFLAFFPELIAFAEARRRQLEHTDLD